MNSELISSSIKVVNQHLLLIIVAGVCSTIIVGENWATFSLIAFVLGFILEIFLCGRIIETILKSENRESIKDILRKNGFNYITVLIVLAIPVLIVRMISQAYIGGYTSYFIVELMKMAVAVVTIYTVPIVFLKRTNLLSIPTGVAYLLSHLQISRVLILFVIAAFLLGSIRILIVMNLEISISIPIILLIGIGVTYLLYIVFAGAAHILTNND
tara:strand:- start:313 stop:954 length:642 start_codon:yes stop_codon:yes gene_type:complete